MRNISAFIAFALLLTGCSNPGAPAAAPTGGQPPLPSPSTDPAVAPTAPQGAVNATSQPASVIFFGGTVLTMDTSQPTAEAIALADDMILAVGSNEDILTLKGANTQVVDLQGLTLMPGFVDTHTHILNEAPNDPATGNLQKAQQLALKNGITTIGNLYTTADFLEQMRSLDASGELFLRTSLYLTYADACGKVLGDWYKKYPPTHVAGEMLRIAGVKVFTDGGSCGHPAVSFDRAVGGRGDLWFTQDQLNKIVSDVDAAGYQIAIHAIGDRACRRGPERHRVCPARPSQCAAASHRTQHNGPAGLVSALSADRRRPHDHRQYLVLQGCVLCQGYRP